MVVGLCGVWLGQFTEWFFLSNKGRINQSPWIWHKSSLSQMAGRLAIVLPWIALNLLPLLIFDASSFEMSEGSTNFTMGLLVCFMLPAFAVGFNTFAFLRFICFKLKLDNPEAVGKEFIPRELLIEQEEKALAEQEEIEME